MNFEQNIDQTTRQLIEEETAGGGETVWWAGKPSPFSVAKSKISIIQILSSLIFIGVLVFIFNRFVGLYAEFTSNPFFNEGPAAYFPYFFGAIFLFIAFNFLKGFLSPIGDLIGAFFTVYVITNQRAMIIQRLPKKSVTSYQPNDFDEIKRVGNDRIGDVFFSKKTVVQQRSNSISFGNNNRFGNGNSFGNRTGPSINIPLGSQTTNRTVGVGFVGVSEPRQVEDMLLSLAKSAD